MKILDLICPAQSGFFNLYGGGSGGGGTSNTNAQPDPQLQAYRNFGLGQAQDLYNKGSPAFYDGQNYVSASDNTTAGLNGAASIANQGVSQGVQSAQNQQKATTDGAYLQNNPYFNQAMQGAAQGATTNYNNAVNGVNSQASMAGRYGSHAQETNLNNANTTMANSLTNAYGNLAYQNYANERGLQQQSALNAPQMAQASYAPSEMLTKVGQAQEGYAQSALDGNMARYNYNANAPQAALNTYMNQVNGSPWGSNSTTTSTQSGGGKIVCTMMNESYGIGSFRNRVWLAHSARMPNAKQYEKGYHTLFLPLVAYAKQDGFTNRIVKVAIEHIAKHRTADIYKEMRNGKRDTLGRVYRAVLEPICLYVGSK
jgi:hypothetical protein